MKFRFSFLFILLPAFISAQVSKDYVVLLSADYTDAPPEITIYWPVSETATSYKIYKKEKEETSWGEFIAELPGEATEYTDTDLILDSLYEYRVIRESSGGITVEGYILSG